MVPTILIPPTLNVLVESMCLHESGTVLCVTYSDGSLTMWNPLTGGILFNQQRSIKLSDRSMNHIWCSIMLDEHRCLLGGSDGHLEFYAARSSSKPYIFGHEELGGITHIVRATATMIIGTTRRGYLIALEYLNGSVRELYTKRLHQWPIRVCHVDLNSSLIFTGSDDHSIKVTNLSNGLCLHTLNKHQAPVNCLAIDPVSIDQILIDALTKMILSIRFIQYHSATLISGCFNGTICVWNGDDLRQMKINAHTSSIIIDLAICGHSSNIVSLGNDKRLCIWNTSNLQLMHELTDITSSCFHIYRNSYLFYCQSNHLYIFETSNSRKISTTQFLIPFLNDNFDSDEKEANVEKIFYASQHETLILQNSDTIYAMHLPQHLFLLR